MSHEPLAALPPRPPFNSLAQMLRVLVFEPEPIPLPVGEQWKQMIARISRCGVVNEIAEETFDYFLDVLPPRYQGRGFFAFAEGAEPIRLFVSVCGQHRCRRLNEDETREFCRLAGIAIPW